MVSVTQLEYLLAVDQHRHFGKAAQSCNVSQPTLSMQLQKVEDELNVILFDRSKKPILPTPEGKKLIEQAKVILREHKKFVDLSRQGETELSGEFRLGVIPTLAPYLIPLFIQEFSEKFSNIELFIDEMKTEDILTALEEDKVDGGLLVTPIAGQKMNMRVLFYEPFHLYVSPHHSLSRRKRISEDDLVGTDVWLLNEGHCLRNQVIKLCALESSTGVFKNIHFESGNLETLRELVRRTQGYTLLPHLLVERLPAEEKKEMIRPFTKPLPTREVSLIYRRDHWKMPILDALHNIILAQIPGDLKKINKRNVDVIEFDI